MTELEKLLDKMPLPVIVAPMLLKSTFDSVVAGCSEGFISAFPAGNERTSEKLDIWLTKMAAKLLKEQEENPEKFIAPYSINLMANQELNPRAEKDAELIIKHKVPVVLTSLNILPGFIQEVHKYGGIVVHDVNFMRHAEKAVREGADGLIAVTAGAGGKASIKNPFAWAGELKSAFNDQVSIGLAGCISTGRDIYAAQAIGADFVSMGTRFLNVVECNASKECQNMIIRATSEDIVRSAVVDGVPASFLKESFDKAMRNRSLSQKLLHASPLFLRKAIKKYNPDGLRSTMEGVKAWKDIESAGHGAGNIYEVLTTAALAFRLKQGYIAAYEQNTAQVARRVEMLRNNM